MARIEPIKLEVKWEIVGEFITPRFSISLADGRSSLLGSWDLSSEGKEIEKINMKPSTLKPYMQARGWNLISSDSEFFDFAKGTKYDNLFVRINNYGFDNQVWNISVIMLERFISLKVIDHTILDSIDISADSNFEKILQIGEKYYKFICLKFSAKGENYKKIFGLIKKDIEIFGHV